MSLSAVCLSALTLLELVGAGRGVGVGVEVGAEVETPCCLFAFGTAAVRRLLDPKLEGLDAALVFWSNWSLSKVIRASNHAASLSSGTGLSTQSWLPQSFCEHMVA